MVIEAKNSAGIRRFSYNSRHQQTRVETETGNVQENRYDAEGLRFELLENGRRTSFVYHDGELLQEEGREEQGTSYHLGAGMEAFRRGQELSYYHRDEQLSTTFITGGHGDVQNSYQYDAFGIPLETTEQLNNRIRYTGQQYDELTEQYYLRARYYNPVAGRFMQEDVYQGDGLNLYAYCGNNPVVYDDPSGYASTSTGKACPPQGKISESVDETSYGKSSSNCTELVPYYPANNGAVPGTEKKIYLMAGDKIDRFGGKKGKFFSPTGTPMEMRALPYDADLSQYRQFEVVKPFEVEASTIAPAFGNIGLGTQYRSSVSVDVLLKKGIIKQVGGN
mgnify:CR=1 FL=1